MTFQALSASSSAAAAGAPPQVVEDHELHAANGKVIKLFDQMIQEIAYKYGRISLEVASANWIQTLGNGEKKIIIVGHDLGSNPSTTNAICNDRAATDTVLEDAAIPHSSNRMFLRNNTSNDKTVLWNKIAHLGLQYGWNFVIKPNSGKSGNDVVHTTDNLQLEQGLHDLFQRHTKICISAYQEIKHKYRIIISNNNASLIYKLVRPHLIGDGKSNILKLFTKLNDKNNSQKAPKKKLELPAELDFNKIPTKGEFVYLTWKHSFSQGTATELLDHTLNSSSEPPDYRDNYGNKRKSPSSDRSSEDQTAKKGRPNEGQSPILSEAKNPSAAEILLIKNLSDLAKRGADAFEAVFAAVDVIETPDGELKIHKISSTVSFEHLIKEHGDRVYEQVKLIYEHEICRRLEIPYNPLKPINTRSSPNSPQFLPISAPSSPLRKVSNSKLIQEAEPLSSPMIPLSSSSAAAAGIPMQASEDHKLHLPDGTATRPYDKMTEEICHKYKIELKVSSFNWIKTLRHGKKKAIIYGYDVGLNPSSTKAACDDKAATDTILRKIPRVHNRLFLKDTFPEDKTLLWDKMSLFGQRHKWNIVIKPNIGAGGKDVFHTTTDVMLEQSARDLLQRHQRICLSPYHKIKNEFRVVILNDSNELTYRKVRPYIIGDGKSNILQLFTIINEKNNQRKALKKQLELPAEIDFNRIPADKEVVYLSWKHNTSQGASTELLDHTLISSMDPIENESSGQKRKRKSPVNLHEELETKKRHLNENSSSMESTPVTASEAEILLVKNLSTLARKAAAAVKGIFVAVDIIEMPDGTLKVIEINHTVCLDRLIKEHGEKVYHLVKSIYEKAICQRMDIPYRPQDPRITRSSPYSPHLLPTAAPTSPSKELPIKRLSQGSESQSRSTSPSNLPQASQSSLFRTLLLSQSSRSSSSKSQGSQ